MHLKTYPSIIEWPISERNCLIVCGLTRSACSKIAATHGILKKHMAKIMHVSHVSVHGCKQGARTEYFG